jgi:hypothetical protein
MRRRTKPPQRDLTTCLFVGECGDPAVVSTIFISAVFECDNKNKVSKPM